MKVQLIIEPNGVAINALLSEKSRNEFTIDWAKTGYSGNVSLIQADGLNGAVAGWSPEFPAFNKVGGEVLNENNGYSFLLAFIKQYGYLRNPPVKIGFRFGEDGRIYWLNGYYLDLKKILIGRYDRLIKVPILDNINGFYDMASALNLRDLWNDARIKDASGKQTNYNPAFADLTFAGLAPEKVHYVISTVPEAIIEGQVAIAYFVAGQMIAQYALHAAEAIAAVAGGVTGVAESLACLAALLIYGGAVVLLITNLLKSLSDSLFQKPKAWYCYRVKDVMQRACEYLGFTFKSTLLDRPEYRHLAYVAATDKPGTMGNKKPGNNPIADKTLLEFMEMWGSFFRAATNINNETKVIEFEEKDYFINRKPPVNYHLAAVRNPGYEQPNIDVLPKVIALEMLKDTNDNNSKENKVTATYTIKSKYAPLSSSENLTMKIEQKFDFCLLERKDKNTNVEKTFNAIYDLVNELVRLFRKGQKQVFNIGNRRGAGLVSSDQIAKDRVFILDADSTGKGKGTISGDSPRTLNMKRIFNHHWAKAGVQHNQFIRVVERDAEHICSVPKILELIDHPVCYDQDGQKIVITKMQQLDNDLFAIEYEREQKYIPDADISVKIA